MTPAETFMRAAHALDDARDALGAMLATDEHYGDATLRDLRLRASSLASGLDALSRHMERAAAQAQPQEAA